MKKPEEMVCGCGCGFRTTNQPLLRLHEIVREAEQRAKEKPEAHDKPCPLSLFAPSDI